MQRGGQGQSSLIHHNVLSNLGEVHTMALCVCPDQWRLLSHRSCNNPETAIHHTAASSGRELLIAVASIVGELNC